jgi:putative oxidoreductase
MERVLGRYSAEIYALVRLVAGLLFACHGAQKLFGVLGGIDKAGATVPLGSMMGLAGVIEFFGGVLIALGVFAGTVAFVCSGEMAAAYFMVHFPRGFWPLLNGGELAALYAFVFLYIASRGSGTWSVDAVRTRR